MKPFEASKLPIKYKIDKELINLISEANLKYGEYKSNLKNSQFDSRFFLNSIILSESLKSTQIEGTQISQDDMYYLKYMPKTDDNLEIQNLKEVIEYSKKYLKDNKTLVLVKIPDNLVNNILNEKIKITLDVIKEGAANIIDITSLNKNIKYIPSLNNEHININIDGNNTTSKDIKLLMGNIIMYKDNKIVEAKTFGIENIKNKSNFSKVVSFSNVNYDKIEVYYTFAY